ncbi:MAG: hypothetical protein IJL92_05380, partial [Thermoguttaceae bacterium]|nr:hypothetical protein [Thermoguttaceae bacterium]
VRTTANAVLDEAFAEFFDEGFLEISRKLRFIGANLRGDVPRTRRIVAFRSVLNHPSRAGLRARRVDFADPNQSMASLT